ncbi:MAG: DoxX family protein [Alphaproteobacteria bacterium]|nr:DoxX family protein [Alphaproteobacteria bacterium]
MIDTRYAPYAALLLRLGLGTMWIAHALPKVLVFTLPGTVAFFEKVGFWGPLAYVVVAAELLGGLAILTGFFGRYVSAALLPIMAGALMTHLPNGWVFSAAGGGWEYPAFLILASAVHVLLGDGVYALGRGTFAGFAQVGRAHS